MPYVYVTTATTGGSVSVSPCPQSTACVVCGGWTICTLTIRSSVQPTQRTVAMCGSCQSDVHGELQAALNPVPPSQPPVATPAQAPQLPKPPLGTKPPWATKPAEPERYEVSEWDLLEDA